MDPQKRLFLGTSGLVLPYRNQKAYPAEFAGRSRISVYGTLFNSIEINSIFYKLPRAATITGWNESVGENFRFTFKVWKQISHSPSLHFDEADLQMYFQTISGAADKKGCILLQFPGSVKLALFEQVDSLLSSLQALNEDAWPIAVEFRNAGWYTGQTYELLNKYKAALVYHDKSGSGSPMQDLDSEIIYLRFHGPDGNYKGSYDDGFLYEYAGYIRDWILAGKTVYIYFNNTMGAALDNLRTLEKYLSAHDGL